LEYVPIADDGTDYVFYLATKSGSSDGECPVVVLGPGFDGVEAAASFVDWIEEADAGRPFPAEA
jgi:NADH dehydrogenase FAD-containing subunit